MEVLEFAMKNRLMPVGGLLEGREEYMKETGQLEGELLQREAEERFPASSTLSMLEGESPRRYLFRIRAQVPSNKGLHLHAEQWAFLEANGYVEVFSPFKNARIWRHDFTPPVDARAWHAAVQQAYEHGFSLLLGEGNGEDAYETLLIYFGAGRKTY